MKKEYDSSIGMPRLWVAALLFVLLTFSCGRTSAPPNPRFSGCEAKVESLSEIRGLRLRMTTDEVRNKFPAIQINEDRERAYLTISKKEKTNVNSGFDLNGLSEAFVAFLDGKISEFRLTYENTGLQNKEEFFSRISSTMNLPRFSDVGSLECYDLRVLADFSEATRSGEDAKASVTFWDVVAESTREKNRKQVEANTRSNTFNP